MAARKKKHSEEWWATRSKPGVRRCSAMLRSGSQCLRVTEMGSVVCDMHGGLAPQVQQRAQERIAISTDAIVQQMLAWFYDPTIPVAVKIKIATDFLDRSSIDRTAKVTFGTDPVQQLFEGLLSREDALEDAEAPLALPAAGFDYDAPDEDGAYSGAIVGDPDYWDGPPVETEPDVIEAEVIEDTPAFIRGVLRNGRSE